MAAFIDLTGQKFNMLTVIERVENANNGEARWKCICDCGRETFVTASNLKSGAVRSCGCLNHTLNGESGSALHQQWRGMIRRCEDKNSTGYENYGGRGITVCNEWHDYFTFKKWVEETKPINGNNLTLDRSNNDLGYSPDNCIWSTKKEQAINRRNTVLYEFSDEYHTLGDWCLILNLPYRLMYSRICEHGWDFWTAISTPLPDHYYEDCYDYYDYDYSNEYYEDPYEYDNYIYDE